MSESCLRTELGLLLLGAAVLLGCRAAAAREPAPHDVQVRPHLGRPMLFIDGEPRALPMYSPAGIADVFFKTTSRFFRHRMGAYFINVERGQPESGDDFFATPYWVGDQVEPRHLLDAIRPSLDEQADHVLKGDPGAFLIVRFGLVEPASWRALHGDQLAVNENGETLQAPSLASDLFWRDAARLVTAVVRYCESRPWSDRIIGYADFMRFEGSHEPLMAGWLYDHGPAMQAAWRDFLRRKYASPERLRQAYADPRLSFDDPPPIPRDALRGPVPDVGSLLYFQPAAANQPLRDYLELGRDLFHRGFRTLARASRDATDRPRFFLYDALKQPMLGWHNLAFFDPKVSWPLAYHDMLSGGGHIDVARLFDAPGFDGLLTPHDYQARGIGGVYQPEGAADSCVLRGKLFFAEMDTRSYTGAAASQYFRARNDKEFAAVTWRNVADSLARGYVSYWMDVYTDWFGTDAMHDVIARQADVLRRSAGWTHRTPPGIAMVLDDTAVLETNGDGRFANEAIFWEQKLGLARCGVPYRVYLFDDLRLDAFPDHRVFYFPNLFRVDEDRLRLLKDKVFRDGRVVLWGPGSGISDGSTLGPDHAARLTGFQFEWWPVNGQRRVQIHDYAHPITRGVDEATILGGPLAYGPMLFPKDGHALGMAWTKQGRNYAGLAVKTFGRGARGAPQAGGPLGPGDWASVFTTAVPIPADLWRGLARFAGAHVYSRTNDVLMAGSSVVALHSIRSGDKCISLPGEFDVYDLVADKPLPGPAREIRFSLDAPDTRVFRLAPPADR